MIVGNTEIESCRSLLIYFLITGSSSYCEYDMIGTNILESGGEVGRVAKMVAFVC